MNSLQFQGVWSPWWVGGLLIGLPILAWYLYRRELKHFDAPYSWLLPLLRSLTILLALLMLLQPTWHQRWHVGRPGQIDVLLDASASMAIADDPAKPGVSRFAQIGDVLLAGEQPLLQRWADANEVRVAMFSSGDDRAWQTLWESGLQQQQTLPTTIAEWQPASWLDQTAIGGALSHTIDLNVGADDPNFAIDQATTPNTDTAAEEGSAPSNSQQLPIVLLSDGQSNAGPALSEFLPRLKQSGRPVYTVGMGYRPGAQDLAIATIEVPDEIFRTDLLSGTIQIEDRFAVGQALRVAVFLEDDLAATGSPTRVPQTTIPPPNTQALWQFETVTTNQGQIEIPFAFPIEATVAAALEQQNQTTNVSRLPLSFRVQIQALTGEVSTVNNQRTFHVAVNTRRQRVLMLAGRSRWEMRYLRNSLERDPNWEVDAFLLQPGVAPLRFDQNSAARPFPTNTDQWLKYDLIVIGEIPPGSLDAASLRQVVDFVSNSGGGLIAIDGQRDFWRSPDNATLSEILPVQFSIPGSRNGASANPLSADGQRLTLTSAGQRLSALQLADPQEQNLELWKRLPAMQWQASGVTRPGSEVLIRFADRNDPENGPPYLVTHQVGAGRVLYFATDESWRWRFEVADLHHQRFWNQVARWAMRMPFSVESEFVSLDSGKIRYSLGERVPLRVRLQDRDGKAALLDKVDVLLEATHTDTQNHLPTPASDDSLPVARVRATLVPDEKYPGVYRGQISDLPIGQYTATIQAPGYPQGMLDASTRFWVDGPENTELVRLACNETLLQEIANQSGGKYFHQSEAEPLVEMLSAVSDGKFLESDTFLWQSYAWFVPMIGLLGLEWWLRKQAGLI